MPAFAVSLAGGIIGAISIWRDSPSTTSQPSTPYVSLLAARDAGLVRLAGFLIAGALFGAIIGYSGETLTASVNTGLFWAVIGLAVGVFTERQPWLRYAVAAGQLARHRILPLRLMTFLDHAHRLGLLRAVGPIYQFRHAEFQDYLTDLYRTPQRPTQTRRPKRHRRTSSPCGW